MFENITKFMKKFSKKSNNNSGSKDTAKERLHLVLMQDRANVSADFLDLMRQEIIDVIKKYIEVDESAIDVRLTNKENDDGTNGAPALYANIPILNIKEEAKEKKQSNELKNDVKNYQEDGKTKNNKEQKQKNKESLQKQNEEQLNQANKIIQDNSKNEENNTKNKKDTQKTTNQDEN